jgi:hypothetical protein
MALVPVAIELNPATASVPTGSPFDAPMVQRVVELDPATASVPSGSPFDAR